MDQLLHPEIHHVHLSGVQLFGLIVVGHLPDVRGYQSQKQNQVLKAEALEVLINRQTICSGYLPPPSP